MEDSRTHCHAGISVSPDQELAMPVFISCSFSARRTQNGFHGCRQENFA
jgi:hypothetical protein